jgi:hypothetical protein
MLKPSIKVVLLSLSVGWAVMLIAYGINVYIDAPVQIQRDKDFIKNSINPYISTIDSFRVINQRLPTVQEFNEMKRGSSPNLGNAQYIRSEQFVDDEVKEYVKGIDWRHNYVLAVWRGEWLGYYISAGKKYVTNNYTIGGAFFGMLSIFHSRWHLW